MNIGFWLIYIVAIFIFKVLSTKIAFLNVLDHGPNQQIQSFYFTQPKVDLNIFPLNNLTPSLIPSD